MKWPVPTTVAFMSPDSSSTTFLGITTFQPEANWPRKEALGYLRVTFTARGSTTSTLWTMDRAALRGLRTPLGGL